MIGGNGTEPLKRVHKALYEAQTAAEYASYRFTRATDPRVRLGMATLLVLLLHVWFLWLLIVAHPNPWNLRQPEDLDDTPPVELWEPETPPEPLPPVEQRVPQVEPQPQRAQVEPQPRPEPVPQPAPQAQAAPPKPAVEPAPVPQIVVPQMTPAPVVSDINAPVVDTTSKPSISTRVKKKAASQLAKKSDDDIVTDVTDFNIHQVPADVPSVISVEPSGVPAPQGQATTAQGGQPGGRLGAMQAQGVPGAGTLGKGRGGLTQAMQNHDYCVAQQQAGKPIPAGCDMADLASMTNIPGKRVGAFDKALAKQAYTAAPGNTEYWQRVNGVPVDPGKDDHMPKKGAYTNPKDQRVVGGCIDDSSCGVH